MRRYAPNARLAAACGFAVLLVVVVGCGGGGGGGGTTPPPPPPTLNITTTSLPDGVVNQAYNQTVMVTGGTGARTFTASAGIAPLTISMTTGAITGTHPGPPTTLNFTVTVTDSGTPQQTDAQPLSIRFNAPLVIQTTTLPNGNIGATYNQTLVANPAGFGALTWSASSGSLPPNLTLNANGVITGTVSTAAPTTSNFTARVQDSSSPTPQVATQPLTITVPPESGRNDIRSRATVLTGCNPCVRSASISPSNDPNTAALDPDEDFYRLTATSGNTVTVTVLGPGLGTPSPLDPVIEIQDVNGARFLANCRNPQDNSPPAPINVDPTPAAFDDVCVNDDIDTSVNRDSMLEFQVPAGGTVTFFVRVFDFRGDARPDLLYQITISGAN